MPGDCLAREIPDRRQLGHRRNVAIGPLIGDRLNPIEQGKHAVSREQRGLRPLPGEWVGVSSQRRPIAAEIAYKIQKWSVRRSALGRAFGGVTRRRGVARRSRGKARRSPVRGSGKKGRRGEGNTIRHRTLVFATRAPNLTCSRNTVNNSDYGQTVTANAAGHAESAPGDANHRRAYLPISRCARGQSLRASASSLFSPAGGLCWVTCQRSSLSPRRNLIVARPVPSVSA